MPGSGGTVGSRVDVGGTPRLAAADLGRRIFGGLSLYEALATTVARKEARTETPAENKCLRTLTTGNSEREEFGREPVL